MDLSDFDNNISSLWDSLHDLEGVIRINSHRRTSDLGKWHVSVHQHLLDTTRNDIDTLLHDLLVNVPSKILQHNKFRDFPEPTCLQTRSSASVATSQYYDWLIDRCDMTLLIPQTITRPSTQRPTANTLSYSQVVTFQNDNNDTNTHNSNTSNNSNHSHKTTHTNETHLRDSLTEDISTITASTVKNMIDDALAHHQHKITEEINAFKTQQQNNVKNIETQLHTFQQQNEAIIKQNNDTHKSDIQHISNEIKKTTSETKQFFEQSI